MGPAMLGMVGMVGMLPGIFGNGGIPDMLDMLGMGGIGAPAEGGSCPPAGDLTADTKADIETGDTWETPKFGGGWLIRAVERFNFGILEPVWKRKRHDVHTEREECLRPLFTRFRRSSTFFFPFFFSPSSSETSNNTAELLFIPRVYCFSISRML